MTTNNSVNVGLSGSTGTGNFVGSTSPTLITPALGTPSGLVLTNSTGDQLGVTTLTNAAAGHVGEFTIDNRSNSFPISLATDVPGDVRTLALTAGEWDLFGIVGFTPDVTTTATSFIAAINTTSATLPTVLGGFNYNYSTLTYPAGGSCTLIVGPFRVLVSATTTYYIIAQSTFAVSTMGAYGGLRARRVR